MRDSFDSIAFCGGGGKGAYQIGVWKALEEHNCLESVKAVSGTSIGGLNAVLFALGDFDQAKRAWYSLRKEDVYAPNQGDSDGVFSRERTIRILRAIKLDRLRICRYQVFINVYDMERQKTETLLLNQMSKEQIVEALLATSSLPLVFGTQTVNGRKYIDGGWREERSAPVAPLYEAGYRGIAILALDSSYSLGPRLDMIKGPNFEVRYPDAHFTLFAPFDDLGGLLSGTMNFSQAAIRSKMVCGYQDARKMLSTEDVYTVKNDYAKINVQIAKKMKELFRSGKDIEDFIDSTNFSNLNLRMPTAGGNVFYTNIVSLFGWKVQQHNLIGLQNHYRILDPQNERRAWVLDPDDIIRALDDYDAARKFAP